MDKPTLPSYESLLEAFYGDKSFYEGYEKIYDALYMKWRYLSCPNIEHDPQGLKPDFIEEGSDEPELTNVTNDIYEWLIESGRYHRNDIVHDLFFCFPDDADACKALILSRDFERFVESLDFGTVYDPLSDGLVELLFALQPVKPGDRAMGAFCRTADYAAEVSLHQPEAPIEVLDYDHTLLARMRAEVIGGDISLTTGSTLEAAEPFDKGFINFFNFKVTAPADVLVRKIRPGGTCAALTQSSNLYYSGYRDVRKTYVDAGVVLAVVTLARGSVASGNRSLIVFGKNETGRIRFVDATALATEGWNDTTIMPEDAQRIAELVMADYDDPVAVSIDVRDVVEAGYMLEPEWHLKRNVPSYPVVKLSDVVTSIQRSAGVAQKELTQHFSAANGSIKYLEVKNLDNHLVEGELATLDDISPAQKRHLLEDGDVVVTKMGPVYKSAVVSVDPGERILPSGNLIVLRPDKTKIDPFYLSIYLSSPSGKNALKLATSGDNTPVLSVKLLKDMPVSLPTLVQQETICEHVGAQTHRIENLKREIREAKQAVDDYLAETVG